LLDQHAERLAGGEEVSAREHGEVQLPFLDGRLRHRRARCKARAGDENVDPPVGKNGLSSHPLHRRLVGDVRLDSDRTAKAARVDELVGDLASPVAVQVGDDDVSTALRQETAGCAADAAGAPGDDCDSTGELAARRRLGELVPLERPVLDRKSLALAQ
jgi:hypothetical protein